MIIRKIMIACFVLTATSACVSSQENDSEMESDSSASLDEVQDPLAAEAEKLGVPSPEEQHLVEEPATPAADPAQTLEDPSASTNTNEALPPPVTNSDAISSADVDSYKVSGSDRSSSSVSNEPSQSLSLDSGTPPAPAAVPEAYETTSIPMPAAAAAVSMPKDNPNPQSNDAVTYMVRKGESLSMIARAAMGNRKGWKQLAEYNSISNPRKIRVGEILLIPKGEGAQRRAVARFVKKYRHSTKVGKGETLSKVAKRELGSERAWRYLWKSNEGRIANPHRIKRGMKLYYMAAIGSQKARSPVAKPAQPQAQAPQTAPEQQQVPAPEAAGSAPTH